MCFGVRSADDFRDRSDVVPVGSRSVKESVNVPVHSFPKRVALILP